MPTTKPRVTITVSHEMKILFDRLTAASGQPASKFISEILEEAGPQIFEPMIEALQLAKNKKIEAWDVLNHALSRSQYQAAQLSLAINEKRQEVPKKRGKNVAKK